MDPLMTLFEELVKELEEMGNVGQLLQLKSQIESEISRIGHDVRIDMKYNWVISALESLETEIKK